MLNITAIIVAAGTGKRFGSDLPKQFLKIKDKPILQICLEKFFQVERINSIILVSNKDYLDITQNILQKFNTSKKIEITVGGKERQDSVWNGIHTALNFNPKIILIHDAVRPLVSSILIDKIIDATIKHKAAIPAIPVKDTIKVREGDFLVKTLDRNLLYAVQTPQGFETSLLISAYQKAFEENFYSTDDANLIERLGTKIKLIEGEQSNLKITTKEDLLFANTIIQ